MLNTRKELKNVLIEMLFIERYNAKFIYFDRRKFSAGFNVNYDLF